MKIFLIILALFTSSCSLFSDKEEEVSFIIPEIPEDFPPVSIKKYKITVTNSSHSFFYLPPDRKSFRLTLPVSELTTVLAYPVLENTLLKPAGFIVSGNLSGINRMSWEEGFGAEALSLAASGSYTENLNISLYKKKLLETSGGNPWCLDRDKAVYGLRYGIFNGSYIKKRSTYNLALPGENENWYRDYPGHTESCGSADMKIMDGENVFINREGTVSLWIFADNLSWIAVYSDVRGGLSGNW